MDTQQFREFGKAAVDYIADYFDNIRNRYVNFFASYDCCIIYLNNIRR